PPALDLHRGLAPGAHVLLEPDLDPPDLVDRGGRQLLRVDERRDHLDEGTTERVVAGDRPRLDERLPLPRGGLARVVLAHRVQRARERPAASAGAQRGVHAQGDPLRGRFRQESDRLGCPAIGALLRRPAGLAVDEQHVDVARVVQLPPPELAERHDGKLRAGGRQTGLGETDLGDRADLLDDLLEAGAEQVPGRDPHHRAPAEATQAVHRSQALGVAPELTGERGGVPGAELGQARELLWVGDEEVGRRRREAEQARRRREHVLAHQQLAAPSALADPGDRHPRELGVGRLREHAAERLGRDHASIMPPRRPPTTRARIESRTNAPATPMARTTRRNAAYPPRTVVATCRRRPGRIAPSPVRSRGAGRRSEAIAAARKTAYAHTSGTTIRRTITGAAARRTPTRG